LIWDPVCSKVGEQVGANSCDAECHGHVKGSFSSDWCGVPEVSTNCAGSTSDEVTKETDAWTDNPCKCTKTRRPVCGPTGSVVASSRCVAECSGLKPKVDFMREWCPDYDRSRDLGLSLCNCPDVWDPVCYKDDLSYVSANACYAECFAHADPERRIIPCP
jgi:hypothetical protein